MPNDRFQNDPNASMLKEVLGNQNTVVFIGSGPSTGHAKDFYPSWSDLVKTIAHACLEKLPFDNKSDEWRDASVLQQVAQDAYDKNYVEYEATLRRTFVKPVMSMRRVFPYLLRMRFKSYVTSNFDPLLKVANDEQETEQKTLYRYPDVINKAAEVSTTGGIFYIHGLACEGYFDPDCLILKKSDFENAYDTRNGVLWLFWESMLRGNDVVFIGTELSDPYIDPIFEKHRLIIESVRQRYSIHQPICMALFATDKYQKTSYEKTENLPDPVESKATEMKDKGIVPVFYDRIDDSYSGLLEVLSEVKPISYAPVYESPLIPRATPSMDGN